MKTQQTTLVVAMLAAILLSAPAFAEKVSGSGNTLAAHHGAAPESMEHGRYEGKGHGRDGGGKSMSRMVEKLDLTDAQKAELDGIHKAARDASEPLRQQVKENKRAEHEAVMSGASEEEIRKLARNGADIRVDLMLQRRAVREQVLGILTPEQRVQLEEMKAQKKAHREERMEKWREKRAEGLEEKKS